MVSADPTPVDLLRSCRIASTDGQHAIPKRRSVVDETTCSLYHLVMVRSRRAGMTRRLTRGNRAILDVRKLEDYCLSPSHPRGRHKARVFRETLDLERSDAPWLRDVFLEAVRSGQALHLATDAWGTHWRLDTTIRRHGKSAVVRTIWIVRTGEDVPRFVTCWVL